MNVPTLHLPLAPLWLVATVYGVAALYIIGCVAAGMALSADGGTCSTLVPLSFTSREEERTNQI